MQRLRRAAAVLWGALAALWLAAVLGWAAAPAAIRLLAILAVLAGVIALATRLREALAEDHRRATALLALLALLAAGVALGTAGLAHEVGAGYYTDEGHYLHKARVVNSGKLLTQSFVYPHLTYYLDAFALWLAGLFPGVTAWLLHALFGVEAAAVDWMVLRLVTAGLGVATVVPVFRLALSLGASLWGAVLAGALTVCSTSYQLGFQVNISDVPSAFFATLCLMYVGRLIRQERPGGYLWAGAASGLAAAAKYPAGVVAVAIVGVWLYHRWRQRSWGWGLAGAGLVSLGVFLALHPSLFAYPGAAFQGPRGIFFGVHQYAERGWVGVTPPSNTLFYLGRLVESFGWGAIAAAAVGVLGLAGGARRRLLLISPFPIVFFGLIAAMSMVVERNLFPLIPVLAVVLGVAAAGVGGRVWRPGRRRALRAVVTVVVLAVPASRTVVQTVSLARESTREAMSAWMDAHLPRGVGILKEEYTPNFNPYAYRVVERRFAFRIPAARFADPRFDYLLLAGHAYGRFFNPDNRSEERARWYEEVFARHRLVHEERPSRWRRGPELRLYRLERPPAARLRERTFTPGDAFLTHPSMAADGEIRFTEPGRVAVFRASFEAGRYTVEADGELRSGGRLRLFDVGGTLLGELALAAGRDLEIVPGGAPGDTVLLELELPKGSRLSELRLAASPAVN